MTTLRIYAADTPAKWRSIVDEQEMADRLEDIGVTYQRWTTRTALSGNVDEASILSAYSAEVEALRQRHGFSSCDVIRMQPDHPERIPLREKFLKEHRHQEFEVRFFVEGCGLFFLHPDDRVFAVLCEAGDLLSVPDGMKHWFDMGEHPAFTCIRLFTRPEGWIAEYTGDAIASRFPDLTAFQSNS